MIMICLRSKGTDFRNAELQNVLPQGKAQITRAVNIKRPSSGKNQSFLPIFNAWFNFLFIVTLDIACLEISSQAHHYRFIESIITVRSAFVISRSKYALVLHLYC